MDCLQAYAGGGSGLTKGEHGNKPYGYFSFGSGARETAPSLRGLRASRGEASGPPADAETYILTVLLICRLKPGASEGQTSFASCSPAPGVAPGCPLRG